MTFSDKVGSSVGRSAVNLVEQYYELADFLRDTYSKDRTTLSALSLKGLTANHADQIDYDPVQGGILDDFKSVLHYKIINKIPGITNYSDNDRRIIQAIHRKYDLPEPSPETIHQIADRLESIANRFITQGVSKASGRSR